MPQVRLDPDVADALQAVADRVGSGSLAHHANRKLRQVLGLRDPAGPAPTVGDRFDGARVSSAAGKAIGAAGRGKTAAARARAGLS